MPKYHVLRNYSAKPDTSLADFSLKVVGQMTGNVNFPPLPVTPVELTMAAKALKNAIAAQISGDQMAIFTKNAARNALILLLDQLAMDVERASQNNPVVMSSAGFGLANPDPFPPTPVGTTAIQAITNPKPGVLDFKFAPADNSWAIELQSSSTPDEWMATEFFTHPREAHLDGLTAGREYLFRVRAHGSGNQKSAWCDPVSYVTM